MEKHLPRFFELVHHSSFGKDICEQKRKILEAIESDLNALSEKDWDQLKRRVIPLFVSKDQDRGWQAAFDILSEARAYKYLKEVGCTEVYFVPISEINGEKTPDLCGKRNGKTVCCEVKTINHSDEENEIRKKNRVRTIKKYLSEAFISKLNNTVVRANKQMEYATSDSRIIFIVINFDDLLHEYESEYMGQIQLLNLGSSGVEVVYRTKYRI